MAGRPKGALGDKLWRDAIRRAAMERLEGKNADQQILKAARAVVAAAALGDVQAAKEMGDRLDGKPAQAVTIDATIHRDPNDITDADLAAVIGTGGGARVAKTANGKGKLH